MSVLAFKDTTLPSTLLLLWDTGTECRTSLAATKRKAPIYVHQQGLFGVQDCAPHSAHTQMPERGLGIPTVATTTQPT